MPDPVPTEGEAEQKAKEEAEQKTEEEPEQETAAVQAVRDQLTRDIPPLLGQLRRLEQSSDAQRARLDVKRAMIKDALSSLQQLERDIAKLTGDALSDARARFELAKCRYTDIVNYLCADRRGHGRLLWHLFLSTVGFGVLLYFVWANASSSALGVTDPARRATLCTVLYCLCAGGLGGATAAIRDFYYYSGKGLFDPAWIPSYRLRPLLGVIMGVVAWALLRGGLAAVSSPTGKALPLSNAVYFLVAFIAAFAVEQVVKKLYDIADTIFAVSERTRRGG